MSANILDGKKLSVSLLESLENDVHAYDPQLVVVQLGDDPASTAYIRQKIKSCEKIGMRYQHRHLPAATNFHDLEMLIQELNNDDDVSGYIVQFPLPGHLQPKAPLLMRAMDPKKDVDGFTAYNIGKMFLSTEYEHLPPATPAGVIRLLDYYNIDIRGKNAVVVGHSNTVGKPLSTMLLNRDATVTTCHIFTDDLAHYTRNADILAMAVGKPSLITADMVKENAVVIDIGITRTDEGLKGDVDFDAVSQKASWISPVPGGVGPMTVAQLMINCVMAKKRQISQ